MHTKERIYQTHKKNTSEKIVLFYLNHEMGMNQTCSI